MVMRTVGILKELEVQSKYTKFNLILYFISIFLWMFVISFSFVRLFYNPVISNGLLLEISVMCIIMCGYLFLQNKKRLVDLKKKELEIILNKRYKKKYI